MNSHEKEEATYDLYSALFSLLSDFFNLLAVNEHFVEIAAEQEEKVTDIPPPEIERGYRVT